MSNSGTLVTRSLADYEPSAVPKLHPEQVVEPPADFVPHMSTRSGGVRELTVWAPEGARSYEVPDHDAAALAVLSHVKQKTWMGNRQWQLICSIPSLAWMPRGLREMKHE